MVKKVGTYSDVVVNSLSPAVQVNQSVQGGQLTPAQPPRLKTNENGRQKIMKRREQLKKRKGDGTQRR
jgi:hypothetical protein